MQQTLDQTPGGGTGEGAFSYLQAVRSHKVLVAAVTLLALIGSIVWLAVRSPTYEASAKLLVTAVPEQEQDPLLGVELLQESVDPTRTIQTAASLIESRKAAERTADRLGGSWTPDNVLEKVEVQPEGESSILAVTGAAETPEEAASLANTFAREAIGVRNDLVRDQVAAGIRALQKRLQAGGDRPDLESRLGQLEALRDSGDPTISVAQLATEPSSQAGAGAPLIIFLALLGGFALGSAAAVLRDLTERSVKDEAEAQTIWPLPVLIRVPRLRRGQRNTGFGAAAPPMVREAFRGLAVQLEQSAGDAGRTILVTSPSTGDGKTSTAVNLATNMAADGLDVVLMDLDLRKPDVAGVLGLDAPNTAASLIASNTSLSALTTTVDGLPKLHVFAASSEAPVGGEFAISAVGDRMLELLSEAREMAPYVIVDTPPLGEVSDALRLTNSVNDTIVVVRPGNTDRAALASVRDILDHTGVAARGFVVIGEAPRARSSYYEYGRAMREKAGRGQPFSRFTGQAS